MGRPAEWERGAQGTEGETQNDGSWSDFSQQSNNSKSASMCGVVVIFIGMSCDILWNRVMLRVASSQQRGLIYEHSKDSLWTQQWGPELPRITRPWHVSSFALLCFALLCSHASGVTMGCSGLCCCYTYWSHTLICLPSALRCDSRHTRFDIYWSVV